MQIFNLVKHRQRHRELQEKKKKPQCTTRSICLQKNRVDCSEANETVDVGSYLYPS